MRILLLRILIGSWMVPLIWIIGFPLLWLLSGLDEALDETKDVTIVLWNGD